MNKSLSFLAVFFLGFMILPPLPLEAQFVPGQKASPAGKTDAAPAFSERPPPSFLGPQVLGPLTDLQRDLNRTLTTFLREASQGSAGALWALLLSAFLYGAVHSLLPGHQKLTVGAYFLSVKGRYPQALGAALLFALFHSLFSLALVLGFRFLFSLGSGESMGQASWWGQALSAAGLALFGLFLAVRKILEWPEVSRQEDLSQVRSLMELPDRLEPELRIPRRGTGRFVGFLALTALLPCPGSLLILFFALSLGDLVLGIGAVGAVAAGMGVVLWGVGTLVIFLKNRGNHWKGVQGNSKLWWALELLSLGFLGLLGLLLFPL